MPLEDVIEQMRNDIRIEPVAPAGVLRIGFQYPDPAKAQAVTAALAQKFVEDSFHARLDQGAGKHFLAFIDPPSLPVNPVFPGRRMMELSGCLLGASIPLAWRRLRGRKLATWGVAIVTVVFCLAGTIAGDIAFDLDQEGQNLLGLPYRSVATMFVQNGSPDQILTIATNVTSRTTLSEMVNDPRLDLYNKQRKTEPLEDVIQHMKGNLAIKPSGQYFTISFEYPDRYKAQQTVNLMMSHLEEAYRLNYGGLPDAPVQPSGATLKVLDAASAPVTPVSPNRYLVAMKGGLAGLIVAAIIAAIRRRWNPESELPVDAVNG